MSEPVHRTGGVWRFLPFALPVLGAALGVLYVNFMTYTGNPLIGLIVGLVAGRLVALLVARIAQWAGFDT